MTKERKPVYLDYNATTPYAPTVKQAMISSLEDFWGNPSSSYARGTVAKKLIEQSRMEVAAMLEAKPSEIIFVSGGTEANNTAIRSALEHLPEGSRKPHIVSTEIEHDATLKLLKNLLEKDQVTVSFLTTNSDGSVDVNTVIDSIRDNTVLITLMLANNETGALLDLKTLCKRLQLTNSIRRSSGLRDVHLHVDAAQALGKVPVSVQETPVDYFTIVGHKFYGPRIGALYVKEGRQMAPLLCGGGQENRQRPGTENTVCIAGLGEAAKLVRENIDQYNKQLRRIKEHLKTRLLETFPNGGCLINFPETPSAPQLPNTLSVSFPGKSGSWILANCAEMEASTGAACHSSANLDSASAMLLRLLPRKQAVGTIRLSIGRETTEIDIQRAVDSLKETIDQARPDTRTTTD